MLIVAVFTRRTSLVTRWLGWRPLVALGSVSYGVYLFHPAIAWLWFHLTGMAPLSGELRHGYIGFAVASILVFALSWAVAALHYRYVERCFMALRAPVPAAACDLTQLAESSARLHSVPPGV